MVCMLFNMLIIMVSVFSSWESLDRRVVEGESSHHLLLFSLFNFAKPLSIVRGPLETKQPLLDKLWLVLLRLVSFYLRPALNRSGILMTASTIPEFRFHVVLGRMSSD